MPLWKGYHPVGAYSAQDKKEFAEKVTAMYSGIPIPKFYVVMIFEEVAADSLYVGGVSHGKFVRLHLEHMARTLPGPIIREWWVKAVEQLIAPFVRDRGYDWEVTIDEVPADANAAADMAAVETKIYCGVPERNSSHLRARDLLDDLAQEFRSAEHVSPSPVET